MSQKPCAYMIMTPARGPQTQVFSNHSSNRNSASRSNSNSNSNSNSTPRSLINLMMDSTRGAQKFMAGGSVGISGGLQGALGGNLGEGLGDFSFWVALGLKVFLCWSSEFESLKYQVRLANRRRCSRPASSCIRGQGGHPDP